MDQDLHATRMRRAAESLEGLSCGDAFGERFFLADAIAQSLIQERAVLAPPWFFTDDTVMALSILETLAEHREITPDALAISFTGRYDAGRGYSPAMHRLLPAIRRQPQSWRTEAAALFSGEGSFGNGSAMRVAPLGAYFARRDFSFSVRSSRSPLSARFGAVLTAGCSSDPDSHRTTTVQPALFTY